MNSKKLLFMLMGLPAFAMALTDPTIVLSAAGSSANTTPSTNLTVSSGLTIAGSGTLDGAIVQLNGSPATTDVLVCPTASLPTGTSCSWDNTKKRITITGSGSIADYQTALRNVQLTVGSTSTTRNLTVTFSAGSALAYTGTGHFYEAVNTGANIKWTDAKAAAAAKTYYGIPGYLATITSQGENDYIQTKLTADAWMGGSDSYTQINASTGASTYANQTASEGLFYWVTGPEAGTQYSKNDYSPVAVNSSFVNWNSGEPNNDDGDGGDENYAEFYASGSNGGKWNDLTDAGGVKSYLVEYSDANVDMTKLYASRQFSVVALPTLTTTSASSINQNAATLGGNISDAGGASVTERGVVYSITDNTPTIGETGVTQDANGTGTGTFSESISGLTAATTYYFRAYATNTAGTAYGTVSQFTTSKLTQAITFASLANKIYGDAGFTISATTDATALSVSFSSATTSVCTVSGSTVTIVKAGTCTIHADQAGDATYAAATQKSQSFTIAIKDPTTVLGGAGTATTTIPSTNLTVSSGLTIAGSGSLDGAIVQLNGSPATTDVLVCPTANLPAGASCSWDNTKKRITITGSGSIADYQTALRNVQLSVGSTSTTRNLTVTFSVGSALAYTGTGHFYEAVNTGANIKWTDAKVAAAAKTYYGITGYLATITSQGENDYIQTKLTADAWMGGSDSYTQINASTGASTYATQSAAEGHFFWVTGPEAGTQYSKNDYSPVAVNSSFVNWNSGEPNNDDGDGGDENYAEFYASGSNGGKWNDLTDAGGVKSYLVEYSDDNVDMTKLFASRQITVQAVVPTLTTASATSISQISATLGGSITADGGASVTERGVVYSLTDHTPTIGETGVTKDANGTGAGDFSEAVTGLTAASTYYVSAYATNAAGTAYGTAISFTTSAKLNQAISFASLANKTIGDANFTVSATTDASGLVVAFSSATTSVCTVSGSTVTLVAIGTCTLLADQVGNGVYNAAAQQTQSFLVKVPKKPPMLASHLSPLVFAEDFGAYALDVSKSFVDLDGQPLIFQKQSTDHNVACSIDGDSLRINSRANLFGLDTVVITAVDNIGQTIADTLFITVQPRNDAPTLVTKLADIHVEQDFGQVSVNWTEHVSDIDGDIIAAFVSTRKGLVNASVVGDSIVIQSIPFLAGTDTLVVRFTDGAASIRDTVVISIDSVKIPIGSVAILQPAVGVKNVSLDPTFLWLQTKNATQYNMALYKGDELIVQLNGLQDTQIDVNSLAPKTAYKLVVSASNRDTSVSDSVLFTTIPAEPVLVDLASLQQRVSYAGASAVLDLSNIASDADVYHIVIVSSVDPSVVLIDTSLTETQLTFAINTIAGQSTWDVSVGVSNAAGFALSQGSIQLDAARTEIKLVANQNILHGMAKARVFDLQGKQLWSGTVEVSEGAIHGLSRNLHGSLLVILQNEQGATERRRMVMP